jgi:hypothetical protein
MTGMPEPGNGMPEPPGGIPHDGNGMPHQTGGMPHRPITGKPHFPCSSPPKPSGAAYDHRPAPGPGRLRRRAPARHTDRHEEVRVIVPDQPPALTPAGARALLRILLDARSRMGAQERRECP